MYNVVAIFKDEAPYLAEWIQFHRLQGFDRFLLFDNDSSDNGGEIARLHGAEVVPWPGRLQQLPAYQHALDILPYGEWTAFIDIDEYLWCPNGETVIDKIEHMYGLIVWWQLDALGVPWMMFGSNNHLYRPPGLTIDAYVRREAGINQHVKQILRIGSARRFLDPHHTEAPYQQTDPFIVCNHYWTRSREEVAFKFNRGRADLNVKRKMQEFDDFEALANVRLDTRLSRQWGDKLTQVLWRQHYESW